MKKSLLGLALANPVVATQEAASVDLDGVNDYFSRASDFTGNADSKTFTFSAWVYRDGSATGNTYIYRSNDTQTGILFFISSSGLLNINAFDSSDNLILSADFGGFAVNSWSHFSVTMNMVNASLSLAYVNDRIQTVNSYAHVDSSIGFTRTNHQIAASSGSQLWKGRLSNAFLSREYLDLSIEANRRIFTSIDPTKGLIPNPNQLADYNAVAGNVTFYFPMDDPTTAHINAAGNGDMTQNGTIARSNRGPNQYNAVASEFDGSSDWLSSSSITGVSNGKTAAFSFSVKKQVAGTVGVFGGDTGSVGQLQIEHATNFVQFRFMNASNSVILSVNIDDPAPVIGKLSCYSLSFDLADTNKRHASVDGSIVVATWSTYTNDAIKWVQSNYSIGSKVFSGSPAAYLNGSIGEFYFDTTYIDLATNNPFYDAETNKPKYLGENGELPTGTSPLIYLRLNAANAGENRGTGGDFTVN